MPFCENCGGSIEPGSKFCDNCGVPIDDQAPTTPVPIPLPPQAPTSQGSPAPTAPPTSAPIPQIYIAVGIAVVVIIIALVFASGAMSGSSKHVIPPTVKQVTPAKQVTTISTPTPKRIVAPGQDPIIGVWRYNWKSEWGGDDIRDNRYRFYTDGTWAESSFWGSSPTDIWYDRGTWKNQGGNRYLVTNIYETSTPFYFIYDPARNGIYEWSEILYIPCLLYTSDAADE